MRRRVVWTLVAVALLTRASAAQVARPAAAQTLIKSQHLRLPFTKEIQRIAVGDTEIVTADLINSREVLVLGRETGRTTLIIWFVDGTLGEYLFQVQRDLALLEAALQRVHPSIRVESAPDRDALVLTGRVPTIIVSETAEAVVRNYLDAGGARRANAAQPFLSAPPQGATQSPGAPSAAGAGPGGRQPATPVPPGQAPGETSRLQGEVQPTGRIINLIQLETLPALPEEKIAAAIQSLGGQHVTIRRVLHGNVRDDARDTLVLEGRVPNQVALVRVIEVAGQIFAGQRITEENIRVIADEAGALTSQQTLVQTQGSQLGTLGSSNSILGSATATNLNNQVRRNLARAKAIEAANGRILSFIEVADLPQIRVDVRLLEVNRSKLLTWDPNWALLLSDFQQPSLNPAQSATVVQGNQAARVGVGASAIQNVLSFLSGGLLNQFQYAGAHAAVDVALSLMEKQGIARALSSPSLTVLSGELAQFQVGGQLPIPISAFGPFAGVTTPAANVTTTGLLAGVDFVDFGIRLTIRPLVGDDDSITLDLQPQVVTPDTTLTNTVRQATGTAQPTTAFQTRALRTSSRLQDGESLLLGGLLSHVATNNIASTPGARDVPGLGWLFRSFDRNDESTELVVMVNPVILRAPVSNEALWAFPGRDELIRSIRNAVSPRSGVSGAQEIPPPAAQGRKEGGGR